jgi:hypothetical protein
MIEKSVIDELSYRLQEVFEIAENLGSDIAEKRRKYYGAISAEKSIPPYRGAIPDMYDKIDAIAEILVSANRYVKDI